MEISRYSSLLYSIKIHLATTFPYQYNLKREKKVKVEEMANTTKRVEEGKGQKNRGETHGELYRNGGKGVERENK